MTLWIVDPKSKEQSVSLTILILSVVALVSSIGLESAGKIASSVSAENFFMAAAGLYFGRKFTSSKGSSVDSDK